MKFTDLRVVFMGTPDFAVASLDALVKAGCTIVGVVTAPDKPAGRGMKLTESAVKKYAVEKGLFVLQPEKLRNEAFIETLRSLKADVQVAVAFRMLPEIVWNMPALGTINVHGSLLPKYRGAAPINWAIINGETETGVTTFKLQHAIDTGHILLQEKMLIEPNENAGSVHDRMKIIGANVLVQTIKGLAENSLVEQPQEIDANNEPLHAPKIFTETCTINFSETANKIHNLVRGLSPFPGAICFLHNKTFKVYESKPEVVSHKNELGQVITDGKTYLKFACSNGYINCLTIQLEGKKKMAIEDFLRGYKMPN